MHGVSQPVNHRLARSLTLHHAVVGAASAPPVLVLHGITGSRRYWLPRIEPLGATRRLIVPDLPGFGLSPKPFTDYTPSFFVESVVAFLDAQGIDGPVPLLGHSLGALIGLELAAAYPGRVARLALLNVPRVTGHDEAHKIWFQGSAQYRNLLMANSFRDNLQQMRRTGWRLSSQYIRRFPWRSLADCRRFTFRSLTSTLEHCLLDYRIDEVLERVPSVPTLMVQGDEDQVALLDRAVELASRPPYPHFYVVRGAGHHPIHTHTELCLELIGAHLDGRPLPEIDPERVELLASGRGA